MGVCADVETLAAKQAITEVLHRYCRAMDRMDRELAQQCYHPDGIDEHSGQYSGSGYGWAEWVERLHAPMTATQHVLTNILIEVSGDGAWSESYWTLLLRIPHRDQQIDMSAGGRYLDHFTCVDGEWAIQRRRTIIDWHRADKLVDTAETVDGETLMVLDASMPNFIARRDRHDPSYDFLGGHRTNFETV
ncbi:nuclear transport factor 2 family protein [Sphingobium chlorophenolicum]|uniref:SnoaL-like domain-containing protein n=1 Tax=Sphingobium chlorophenolicum TaxID=46429 RepID=A0A081R9C7_SPHCR|nr:nuclear transport factor 2 family protein [Sphingobium chlorophenolicum]KEQ51800.1 hypothetical protein BV95_03936 [Sphingobium chlorophenolicum]